MDAEREILDIRNAERPENVWPMVSEKISLSLKATPGERGVVWEIPICFLEPGISNTSAEMLGKDVKPMDYVQHVVWQKAWQGLLRCLLTWWLLCYHPQALGSRTC